MPVVDRGKLCTLTARHLLYPSADSSFEREFDGERISCGLLECHEFGPGRCHALGL